MGTHDAKAATLRVIVGSLAVVFASQGVLADGPDHRSGHDVVQAANVPRRQPLCVSCGIQGIEYLGGFTRVNLGYPVADWFPVDIDSDNVWELAVTVAGAPTRVGVFSPKAQAWVDGPHPIPVTERCWGVGDYDGDGSLEYAYYTIMSDSVCFVDPAEGTIRSLWRINRPPYVFVSDAIFWGYDDDRRPLVGFVWIDHYTSPDSCSSPRLDGETEKWVIQVCDLFTGREIRQVPAGPSRWFITRIPHDSHPMSLVMHRKDVCIEALTSLRICEYFDQIQLLNPDWSTSQVMTLSRLRGSLGPQSPSHHDPYDGRYLEHIALGDWDDSNGTLVLSNVRTSFVDQSNSLLSLRLGQSVSRWDASFAERTTYSGIAAFDIQGIGRPLWILPLADGNGWEVRQLEDGVIIDTLRGMPPVDLQTGPLSSATQSDLFFVSDSSIYIWVPLVSALAPQSSESSPKQALILSATPNPSNSSVTLRWTEGEAAISIEIFNVTGQKVRVFGLSDTRHEARISWDATDTYGNPVPSGLYFAKLVTTSSSAVAKLVLLK